jgi:catechol 2,3-dioxygenase-like lactoylglutathione lyase family enzyme
MPELSFHHLGLCARDPARAAAFLGAAGYTVGPLVHDPLQGVELALASHPTMPTVEIVAARGVGGPLAAMLHRAAEMLYHVCFETPDRDATLGAFAAAGSRVLEVSPPAPAVLFGGRRVSFHRVGGFGLIELLDRAEVSP